MKMKTSKTKTRCFVRSEFGMNVQVSEEIFEELSRFLTSEKIAFRIVLSSNGAILCK